MKPSHPQPIACRSGFTLIELSIVLVIVGLIVGGIMVGQDMILAARIRHQIKQMQDLDTQINTFRLKYNCLPGDCPNATSFFGVTDPAGKSILNGDNDGLIRSTQGSPALGYNPPYPAQECLVGNIADTELTQVYLHLNDAGLGKYTSDGSNLKAGIGWPLTSFDSSVGMLLSCLSDPITSNTYAPLNRKLLNGNVITLGGLNYSGVTRIQYILGLPPPGIPGQIGILVSASQQIDQKIDDGLPLSGKFGLEASRTPACLTGSNSYPVPSSSCYATSGMLASE